LAEATVPFPACGYAFVAFFRAFLAAGAFAATAFAAAAFFAQRVFAAAAVFARGSAETLRFFLVVVAASALM
jgi:hypothetical protein